MNVSDILLDLYDIVYSRTTPDRADIQYKWCLCRTTGLDIAGSEDICAD